MDIALLAARLLLAAVFAVAGLTKLADRAGSRRAIIDFGLPAALAAPLGLLLPLAELAVAGALVPAATAWWGAAGALGLLLLFIAGIAINLARGRTPDCRCFGQLHSEPVGWPTLARNGGLAAVAGFVLWQGQGDAGPSAVGWLGDLTVAQRLTLAGAVTGLGLLATEAWLLLQLLGQSGRVLARLDALEARLAGAPAPAPAQLPEPPTVGLPVGAPAPAFSLSGLHGETLTLASLRAAGKPVLLLFTDPNCGPCNALLPEVGGWQRDRAAALTVALISRGTPEANRAKSAEHGLTRVLLQRDFEVAGAYQAGGTPSAVLIRPDGTIGSPVASAADAIRALLARTVGAPAPPLAPDAQSVIANGNGAVNGAVVAPTEAPRPAGLKVGDPTPALKLPDLTGKAVDLASFRGHQTLVLFWNPGCGFCTRMLDDLKTWEARPPKGAPKLLLVSTGTAEENRAMGLRSLVVLDRDFEAGRAFGAGGTPAAVLIDARGNVASEVTVGAPAVLALAQGSRDPARAATA